MPQGQAIGSKVENLIGSVYEEHPKWKAPRVRNEVAGILFDEAIEEGKKPLKDFPSLSVVQKVLGKVRKNLANPRTVDKPWSMSDGIAEGVEISSETLPYVLTAWIFMKQAWNQNLTIREVRWLNRLYGAAKTILVNLGPRASIEAKCNAVEPILRLACLYAAAERIAELTGKRTPSVALDFTLWEFLTRQSPTPELLDKLFPDKQQRLFQTEKGWLLKITKRDQAYMRKVWKQLGFSLADFNEVNQHLSISFEVDESLAKEKKRQGRKVRNE